MSGLTASKAFREVETHAEGIKSDETAKIGTMSLGDVLRQGDLMIVCIGALPATRKPREDRQLAPGTSQGSRHVLQGDCELFDGDAAQVSKLISKACPQAPNVPVELVGPVFRTIGEVEVDHPEHGNRILPAGECFAVVYQLLMADTLRRQLD